MSRSQFDILRACVIALALTTSAYGRLIADAGRDQHVYHPNEPVMLDGSASVFPDPPSTQEYQWTQVDGPEVQLSDPAVCRLVFMPPVADSYKFELVVSDGRDSSTSDTVVVVVGSVPTHASHCVWPVSDGGNGHAYQAVAAGELIPWTLADATATAAGGYLATITSSEEDDFVYDMIGAGSSYLFLSAMGNYYGPWLGGYQRPGAAEPGDGWCWVTDEPFEYTAWNVGEPSNTAGGLNEDRLHYLGHGGPEPLWNDQLNAETFGPTSFVIEYDPVVCEAEDATAISGGTVESAWGGHSGTGYVTLHGQASSVRWVVDMDMAGPKKVQLRYAHGASKDVALHIAVNGVAERVDLADTSVRGWPAWGSVAVNAYFHSGGSVVEVWADADDAAVSIDNVTLFDNNTNLVFNRCITVSSQEQGHPAAHALDGDPRTYWRAENLPQWVEVDLGDIYEVHCIRLVGMYGQAPRYHVEATTHPGGAYTCIVDRTEYSAPPSEPEAMADIFEPVPARYVRLTVAGDASGYGGSSGVAEFYVSAAAAPAPISIGTVGYRTIQAAIDAARQRDVVTLAPGMYTGPGNEALDMKGKRITLASSDPNDPDITARTVIGGSADAPAVRFDKDEDADCVLAGLTLTGAQAGVYIEDASPTIRHCRIKGNVGPGVELYRGSRPHIQNCIIAGNRGPAVAMRVHIGRVRTHNYPLIANCTLVENLGGGIKGDRPTVVNSIIYFNDGPQIESAEAAVTYCDVQGGSPGEGNFDADPCFAAQGFWVHPDDPETAVSPLEPEAIWVNGDYHLQSEIGRWEDGAWVTDAQTSPCIDAGDPTVDSGSEPYPGGERINVGAYGGTYQAGMARRP